MPLEKLLWYCFWHHAATDHANAAVHCATVRYSPITFRLAEYLWEQFPSYRDNDSLKAVWLARGEYPEDPGRE